MTEVPVNRTPTALSPQAYQALLASPALRGLGDRDRETVAGLFEEQCHPAGTTLFQEGEPGASVHVIVSGEVEVRLGRQVVATLGPGEWVGEMALLAGVRRSATVVVTLDCRLLTLGADAFARLLALQPRLYEELTAVLSRRLSNTSRGESARRRHEIVLVEDRGGWKERAALVQALAAELEQQLGRPVAIVSVARRGHGRLAAPRERRPDAVLLDEPAAGETLRERVAARLAAQAAEVPLTLVEVDDPAGETTAALRALAGTAVVLADGGLPAIPAVPAQRRIVVYDRRRASTPALGDGAAVVLGRTTEKRRAGIARLARVLTRRTVGLALGSGTAFGLAHIGVLAALEEAGVAVDFIAGSSMGSIIGAGYALGRSAAELRTMAVRFGALSNVLRMTPSLVGLALDLSLIPGLLGDRFLRFIDVFGPVRGAGFEDLEIPFRAVATDIATGARVEIAEGKLSDALRASASVPWFLAPYRLGDRFLVDGGTSDPVPSETVRSMGADVVVAVNAVPSLEPRPRPLANTLAWLNPLSYVPGRPPGPDSLDVAMRSLLILQHALGDARAGEADVLITPVLSGFTVLEFWRAAALIDKGAEAARAALPAIREKLAVGAGRIEAAA